ncbi:unnamed protein product [Lactuca virosa]|uniref:Uncharacterized protein n=1 Tax=Lactuca virosa TaxID=75947 RepID=A0AAU9MWP4_9ASTR|nr:unnamed protein product [Lactuca virosa]
MASSSTGMYVSVDFHYNGFFSPNPLVYLDPVKTNVRDVDFGGFTYKEFLLWLTKLTNGACDNVYYCMRKESLCEGIRRIACDADYWEFVETVYSLESDSLQSELDVYIDHRNEPILDWADNELLADGKGYQSDYMDEEDDKDSEVSMAMEYEHEWDDEEEHTFDKTVGDPFLDKLLGHISDDDEEEANNGKLKDVVFPVHNENQEWEQMVPVLEVREIVDDLCSLSLGLMMKMVTKKVEKYEIGRTIGEGTFTEVKFAKNRLVRLLLLRFWLKAQNWSIKWWIRFTNKSLKYPHAANGALLSSVPVLYFLGLIPEKGCSSVVSKNINVLQERTKLKVQVLQGNGCDELLKIMDYPSLPHFCRRSGSDTTH